MLLKPKLTSKNRKKNRYRNFFKLETDSGRKNDPAPERGEKSLGVQVASLKRLKLVAPSRDVTNVIWRYIFIPVHIKSKKNDGWANQVSNRKSGGSNGGKKAVKNKQGD